MNTESVLTELRVGFELKQESVSSEHRQHLVNTVGTVLSEQSRYCANTEMVLCENVMTPASVPDLDR